MLPPPSHFDPPTRRRRVLLLGSVSLYFSTSFFSVVILFLLLLYASVCVNYDDCSWCDGDGDDNGALMTFFPENKTCETAKGELNGRPGSQE